MNVIDYISVYPGRFQRKTFEKGEILAHEDDLCRGVYIVIKGRVEVVSFSLSGNKLVYNALTEGEVFGNNLTYSSSPYFKGDVVASEPSEVAFIKKERLTSLLMEDKGFLEAYLKEQSDFGKRLNSKIKLLSIDSAEERFRYFLLANKGEITFKSITSLAEELGLKRETLSRLISRLEKEQTINRSVHKIALIKS